MGHINAWEFWCLLCHRKTFCAVNKPFLSYHVSHIYFQPASVLLKGRMGAAIAPSWTMNIPHIKITTGPGGMMIKRLPRVTFHYRVLFPKARLPVPTDVFCCVKDILGWNSALLVWERSKNDFLFEMYWLFRLCVPCKPGTCSSFFFQDHILPSSTFHAALMPIKFSHIFSYKWLFGVEAPWGEAATTSLRNVFLVCFYWRFQVSTSVVTCQLKHDLPLN